VKFSELDPHGKCVAFGIASEIPRDGSGNLIRTVEEHLALQVADGNKAVAGHPDQELPNMPEPPVQISVGDTITIPAPDGSTLSVGDQSAKITVSEDVTFETDGTYEMRVIPPFPYMPWNARVVVE